MRLLPFYALAINSKENVIYIQTCYICVCVLLLTTKYAKDKICKLKCPRDKQKVFVFVCDELLKSPGV